jgi:YfiH family protein
MRIRIKIGRSHFARVAPRLEYAVATLIKRRTAKRAPRPAGLQVLQAARLKKISWLVHGFSTRPGGSTTCYGARSLNLGFTKDDTRVNVERNRKQLLLALGASGKGRPWPLVALRQVHSDVIHVVRELGSSLLVGDGLVTNLPGIALGVQTADCLPVLLVDVKNKAVGAFHAGWRGTAQRMVEKGVGTMRHEYGSLPEDIYAVIGPGIQKCCYSVGEELRSEFQSQFSYADELFHEIQESDPVREKYPMLFLNARAPGHGDQCINVHLDLREANRRQLLAVGVPEKQITSLEDCTACNTRRLFSHRAEKGNTGRMMAVVGITP